MLKAIAALLLAKASTACSCPPMEPAGFVHADLKHLPANARGALLLAPRGLLEVRESDFILTSNNLPLDVQIAPLDGTDLIRIEPKNGFRPGAHYMLRYTGDTKYWIYPSAIDFVIDRTAIGALSYGIALEGTPQRRLLTMGDGRGSCFSNQPVISQDFRYQLPAALQPYREAVIYASEMSTKGAYSPRRFSPLVCAVPTYGSTAYGDERDLVQVDCAAPSTMRIRGRVGFLEVEDTLQTTSSMVVNLRTAAGKACHGMGMLREALAAGDTARALDLVCKLPSEQPYEGDFAPYAKPRRVPKTPAPSAAKLAALSERATPEQRACIAAIR